jgi:Cu/Ag efflux protein CusF
MSRHLLRAAMALGIASLALSFAAPVRAADTNTPTTTTAPKPKPRSYTGDVTAIDAKAGTIIVKKEGAESKTFKIGEKTRYATADKAKDAALTDIKVGDKVTVSYTEEDGVLTAHRIGPPKSTKKEATPAP